MCGRVQRYRSRFVSIFQYLINNLTDNTAVIGIYFAAVIARLRFNYFGILAVEAATCIDNEFGMLFQQIIVKFIMIGG